MQVKAHICGEGFKSWNSFLGMNWIGNFKRLLCIFSVFYFGFSLQEKCGRLDHQQFKSCLRALGYDLPMVDEGQPEPEFQRILDIVDPNRDGYVTLQEYMAFMISKETENIQSSEEIESAFRALSKEFRPYVTAEELYAVSCILMKLK